MPVTLIGGFLGAGKTTLIGRLLERADRRIAVIENELAETPVDQLELAGAADAVVELAGGCLCCTARDGLADALATLLSRRPAPEHIVVEASGVAAPGPIVDALLPRADVWLRSVVCVCDCLNVEASLARPELPAQIACADVVVLTKGDLAGAAALARAAERVAELNPAARIVEATQEDLSATVLGLPGDRSETGVVPELGDHLGLGHGVTTVSLAGGALDLNAAREWVAAVAATPGVLRVKGLLAGPGAQGALAVQAVRGNLDLRPADPRSESLLVVIGEGLEDASLREGWARLRPAE